MREEAYRQAVNHPIQAGAQEIIKLAMAEIWKLLVEQLLLGRILLMEDTIFLIMAPDAIPAVIVMTRMATVIVIMISLAIL